MSDLPQRLRLNATIPLVMEAAARIEALEAECDRWAEQANTTAASLRTKVKTLEAALRVFADPLSWRRDGSCDPNSGRFEGQSIARTALAPEQDK